MVGQLKSRSRGPIRYAAFSQLSAGTAVIVEGVADRRILVLSYAMAVGGGAAHTLAFEDEGGGEDLVGPIPLNVSGYASVSSEDGIFESSADGVGIQVTVAGANVGVGGVLTFVEN